MTEVAVAAVQFGTTLDKARNVEVALSMLDRLVQRGEQLDLVCLPEMFTLRALGVPDDSFAQYLEDEGGPLERELAERARRLSSYVVAGSFLERSRAGDVRNQCLVFDRMGRVAGRYAKTHLFDGPGHFSESARAIPGDRLVVVDTDFGKLGIMICYELRFPEVARTLALAGATVLAVPNSWPADGVSLNADQLQILLKGTALQNLFYVVHANQYGHVAGLDLCGRSCVVDPRGQVVAQASDADQEIVTTSIDLSRVDDMRRLRTTFTHRRPDLYRPEAVVTVHPGQVAASVEESP